MIQINLLDWREKRRLIQNNRFFLMVGIAVVFCAILIFLVNMFVNAIISESKANVTYLSGEVGGVEKKIQQIKDLEKQKDLLLARRDVVESLQASRTFVIKIFDNLSRVVPSGVILNEMSRKGDQLSISGTGDSNTAVAELIKNVQRLRWVKEAKLTELKNSDVKTEATTKKGASKKVVTNSAAENRVDFKVEISMDPAEPSGAVK